MKSEKTYNCFWGHHWGKWKSYRLDGEDIKSGANTFVIRQKRYCMTCNKMEDIYVSHPEDIYT